MVKSLPYTLYLLNINPGLIRAFLKYNQIIIIRSLSLYWLGKSREVVISCPFTSIIS